MNAALKKAAGVLSLIICIVSFNLCCTAAQSRTAVLSVELFSIGGSYLCEPETVTLYDGENAAQTLLRFLAAKGFTAFYSGSPESGFYLAYISNAAAPGEYNGYTGSGALYPPLCTAELDIQSSIPGYIKERLEREADYFDENDYYENSRGYIGEFVFTNMSGWMYSVNNSFPAVSLSEYSLKNGDVLRLQFTLALGADIGGGTAVGGAQADYFATADKTELTALIAEARAANAPLSAEKIAEAEKTAARLNAAQNETDAACAALEAALQSGGGTTAAFSEAVTGEKTPPQPESTAPETEAEPQPALSESQSTAAFTPSAIFSDAISSAADTTAAYSENGSDTENSGIFMRIIIAVTAGIAVFIIIYLIRRKNRK